MDDRLAPTRDPRAPRASLDAQVATWAEAIREKYQYFTGLHGKSVEATIALGQVLRQAKKALDHGQWGAMFTEGHIPFGQDKAAMLMRIARNPVLANSDECRNLPASWTTLYRLARHPDHELKAAFVNHLIHPQMSEHEAITLGEKPSERPWDPAAIEQLVRRAAALWVRWCPAGDEAGIEHLLRRFGAGCLALADELQSWRAARAQLSPAGLDALQRRYDELRPYVRLREDLAALRHLLDGKVTNAVEADLLAEIVATLEKQRDSLQIHTVIPTVLDDHETLTTEARDLYGHKLLACITPTNDPTCSVTVDTLRQWLRRPRRRARPLRASPTQVRATLHELEAAGLLTIEEEGTRQRPYRLRLRLYFLPDPDHPTNPERARLVDERVR